jgi:hypothetical protein
MECHSKVNEKMDFIYSHANQRRPYAMSSFTKNWSKNGCVEPVATWIIVWFLQCHEEATKVSPKGLAASQDL